MSKVIRFLESVGAAPGLLPDQYATLVAGLDVGDAERKALLDRNATVLGDLLGARAIMRCSVFEPQREPAQEPDHELPDDGGEETEYQPDDSGSRPG